MLAGLLDQASGIMTDNAKWDDAVDHSYGEVDPQWMLDTWGYSSADQNYDTSFVIDDKSGTVVGFSDGKSINTAASDFFGPAFAQLVATLPQDGKTFTTAAEIQLTAKGLAVVSVAPILPNSEGKTVPGGQPRILAFAKTLTPEYVAELGNRLIIKDLEIVPTLKGQASSVPVGGAGTTPAAYLVWNSDRPGDTARAAVQGPAIMALGGMLTCMILFAFISSHLSLRLRRSERDAWTIAHRDTLTALPNRHAVMDLLEAKLSERKPEVYSGLTVMIADLDDFKEVNDSYGHHIGDDLIRAVAAGLSVVGEKFGAIVSRLGGDEFAIILDGNDCNRRAAGIAAAALEFLVEPFNLGGRIARVGMSIGIASTETDAVDGPELIRRADVAMYHAKGHGKNRVCVYEPQLDSERNSRILMAKMLAHSLDCGQIEVAFQPVVEAKSSRIVSVEALARWKHPDGTYIPPDEFIRVAEEFGLIDRLGDQVLSIACREAAAWPGIGLSVNISPAQFRNPQFVDKIIAIIDQAKLPRERLELEVTEGYLIEHQDRAKPIIAKLRSMGIHVALDDFGTGYSSIGYLRQYHFDQLKIDKSLIRGMMTDASARSIIQATAVLAQSMRMAVTAEGVEAEEEASLLRLAGCDSLQGFHFGRPQSAAAISALLEGPKVEMASAS